MTLVGPVPRTLIDPASPAQLRQAMRSVLSGWAAGIHLAPASMKDRGYQIYTVHTLCRVLYTLHFGTVVSKPVAVRWARETLDERWVPLVERSWARREVPGSWESPDDANETLEFIRYVRERGLRSETLPVLRRRTRSS